MLFILTMDPIQLILEKATEQGILQPIGADPIKFRTNLYADDAAIFLRPSLQDMTNLQQLLRCFGKLQVYSPTCTSLHCSPYNVMTVNSHISSLFFLGKLVNSHVAIWDYHCGLAVHEGLMSRSSSTRLVPDYQVGRADY